MRVVDVLTGTLIPNWNHGINRVTYAVIVSSDGCTKVRMMPGNLVEETVETEHPELMSFMPVGGNERDIETVLFKCLKLENGWWRITGDNLHRFVRSIVYNGLPGRLRFVGPEMRTPRMGVLQHHVLCAEVKYGVVITGIAYSHCTILSGRDALETIEGLDDAYRLVTISDDADLLARLIMAGVVQKKWSRYAEYEAIERHRRICHPITL